MYHYPPSMEYLIEQLAKLPTIGPKSAQRLAFFLLHDENQDALNLAKSIIEAREKVKHCPICANLTDSFPCSICQNENRSKEIICVVEQPRDVVAIERMGEYNGLFHVLHGSINPMEGIGPGQLTIDMLLKRLENSQVKEVVMATNPNVEGEATALYLAKKIKPLNIRVTRIAHGVPVGGDLEYADEITLAKAFKGREEI